MEMSSSPWDDDDQLLADLAAALHDETVPTEELRRMAQGAFAWRTVDTDLAALAYDSLLDEGLATRARSATGRRTVVFEHAAARIELELTSDGLVGQLAPYEDGGTVALWTVDGLVEEVTTDDSGCFLLDVPVTGPIRLRLRAGTADVTTDWIGL